MSEKPTHAPASLAARLAALPDDDVEPCSPEPKCCCLDFWKSHPPDCPRVLAGLEKAGEEPANEPLRRRAEEWILRRAGLTWHQEALSLTRLLERVVRECAGAACRDQGCCQDLPDGKHWEDCTLPAALRHFGLSPESAPEPK